MYRLTLLGPPSLHDASGRDVAAITAQPERLLLLAWLVLDEPAGYRRREELLARFFPGPEGEARRNALRQALHALRTHLDASILQARGTDELRVAPDAVAADLTELRLEARAGRLAADRELPELCAGVDLERLPEPVAAWVRERRAEVAQLLAEARTRVAAAEAAATAPDGADPELPAPAGVVGAGSAAERVPVASPKVAPPVPAPTTASTRPVAPTTAQTTGTRADYAKRLSAATAPGRPGASDEPATRLWTWVAGGVVLLLVAGAAIAAWRRGATSAAAPNATDVALAVPDTGTATARLAAAAAAARQAPNDPAARLALADAHAALGQPAAALPEYAGVLAVPSAWQGACAGCRAARGLAEAALAIDSVPLAESALREWMRQAPADSGAPRAMAELLLRAGRVEESAAFVPRGGGDGWAREQRIARAALTGAWPVARDVVLGAAEDARLARHGAWWRVAFERWRGRPQRADSVAAALGLAPIAGADGATPVSALQLAGTQAAVRLESEDGRLLTLVAPPGPDGLTLVAVRATALAARQDSAALRLLADSLARAADAATGAARAVAPYVAGLAAQLAGAHDTAVVRLGAALAVSRTAHPLANIALARSLVTLGRAGEAVAALRPALRADPYARGAAGVPFPIVREQLAYAHLAAGARDSARVHARVALEAWTEGEPLWRARALALRRSVGLVRRPAADSGAAPTPGAQLE